MSFLVYHNPPYLLVQLAIDVHRRYNNPTTNTQGKCFNP